MTDIERKQIEDLIRELSGKNYNFEKFSDSQLLGMRKRFLDKAAKQKKNQQNKKTNQQAQKENSPEITTNEEQTCDKCGHGLNFLGQCPVCDLGDEDEGRNRESFMLRKQSNSIKENFDTSKWYFMNTKKVFDSDGFLTDYTWYSDGNKHIMILGDKEIYEPDIDNADFITDDKEEASDWFDFYETSEYNSDLITEEKLIKFDIEYTDRESGEEGLKDTIKGKDQADAISRYFSNPRNVSNEITKIYRKDKEELNEVAPIIAAAAGAALTSFASQAGSNLANKIFEDVSEEYSIGDYVKFSDDIGKIIDIIKTSDGKEKYEIMSDYRYSFLIDPEDIDEISSEDEFNSFYSKTEDLKEVFYYKDGKKITEDVEETFGEPPAPGKDTGVANTLSALIQDEWQAIDGYNKAIENFTNLDMENIAEVLKDIVAEENIHVGQLQAALQTIATNAGEIATGEKEAAEQLGDA